LSDRSVLEQAVEHLSERDPRLSALIARIGPCLLRPGPGGFPTLARSMIGQQLSVAAARAIHRRVCDLTGEDEVLAERLAVIEDEALRSAGPSRQKIGYLRDLTNQVLEGTFVFAALEGMTDEQVISALTEIRGVGRWTAEMYLMFSMHRLDIFPFDDLAVRRVMQDIYMLDAAGLKAQANVIADRWRPYRSVACWYLYAHLNAARDERKNS
jgi:DNA-3-methyladenine glycosylase II